MARGGELSSLDIMRVGLRLDPDTTMGGPQGQFPSTQLSLLEAASSGAALPNAALERVSALYWKPVHRFIRIKFRKLARALPGDHAARLHHRRDDRLSDAKDGCARAREGPRLSRSV